MIVSFEEIASKSISSSHVGNKAYNLAQINRGNIKVPYGLVLTKDSFTGLNPARPEVSALDAFSKKLYDALKRDTGYFAVRSSCSAEDTDNNSFAGQYKTILGVSKPNLCQAILEVYASLNSGLARNYSSARNDSGSNGNMAVIVQEMIPSEKSGVAFTYDIINKNSQNCIVEATYGLCEPIVSGTVNPDLYIIDKDAKSLISFELGDKNEIKYLRNGSIEKKNFIDNKQKRVLSDGEIGQLAEILIAIEHIFKKPQDVEWTLYNNLFYVLQSRPITVL